MNDFEYNLEPYNLVSKNFFQLILQRVPTRNGFVLPSTVVCREGLFFGPKFWFWCNIFFMNVLHERNFFAAA